MPTSDVSIIVTTYNRHDFLRQTLASIAAQSHKDIETIVVDDGSKSDPTAIVTGFGSRFRCIRQENAGQPAARNRGIAASTAPFLAFVDDDDLWEPRKLELQLALLSSRPDIGWCHTNGTIFDHGTGLPLWRLSDRIEPTSGNAAVRLAMGNTIASPSVMVRRILFLQTGGFDTDSGRRFGEDWLMWMKLASLAPLGWISEDCFRLRQHAGSMTNISSESVMRKISSSHRSVLMAARDFAPRTYSHLLYRALAKNRWLLARQARYEKCLVNAALLTTEALFWHSRRLGNILHRSQKSDRT